MFQLEDLVNEYPEQDEPEVQRKIAQLKEFQVLASYPTDIKINPITKGLKHQDAGKILETIYDNLFVVAKTGIGKTGYVALYTEWLKKNRGQYKRCYFLVSGDTHKSEIVKQVACIFSNGDYITEKVKAARTATQQKSAVTKAMNKWYTITTYGTIVRDIQKALEDLDEMKDVPLVDYPKTQAFKDYVIKKYSDCVFWIDELHNLRVKIEQLNSSTVKLKQKTVYYMVLHAVFMTAERIKVFGTTATPIINFTTEIISQANLIFPRDRQLPLDLDLSKPSIKELEPYFRGLFSYVNSLDVGNEKMEVKRTVIGKTFRIKHNLELVVYPSYMGDFQRKVYQKAVESEGKESTIYNNQIQASNCVFPIEGSKDGTWGSSETNAEKKARQKEIRKKREAKKLAVEKKKESKLTTVVKKDKKAKPDKSLPKIVAPKIRDPIRSNVFIDVYGDEFKVTPLFNKTFVRNTIKETLRQIAKYSCKDADIIRILLKKRGQGVSYVYDPKIYGSGSIMLAAFLQAVGYERFYESKSIFKSKDDETIPSYCQNSSIAGDTGGIRKRFNPENETVWRYVMLTSETSDINQTVLKEAITSSQNVYGKIIQVFITSEVGKQVLTLKHGITSHLRTPNWTESENVQADSRIWRFGVYNDMIAARLAEGITDPILVEFYYHVAFDTKDFKEQDAIDHSINFKQYAMAKYGNLKNEKVMDVIKACAIDAQIHLKRNHPEMTFSTPEGFPTQEELLEAYKRGYICDPPARKLKMTNYINLSYKDKAIEYFPEIENIFINSNIAGWDSISEIIMSNAKTLNLSYINEEILLLILTHMIQNKKTIRNRDGFYYYLCEDRGRYFLQRNYPGNEDDVSSTNVYYTDHIIIDRHTPLKTFIENIIIEDTEALAEEISQFYSTPDWRKFLDQYSLEMLTVLVEQAIEKWAASGIMGAPIKNDSGDIMGYRVPGRDKLKPILGKAYTMVLWRFRYYIFNYYEPISQIAYNKELETEIRQGKKKEHRENREWSGEYKSIKPAEVDSFKFDTKGKLVFAHTLDARAPGSSKHQYTRKQWNAQGIIRTYTKNWRSIDNKTDELEAQAHNTLIQILIRKLHERFDQMQIYGFNVPESRSNSSFNIADRSFDKDDINEKKKRIGKNCASWDLKELIYSIGRLTDANGVPNFPYPRDNRASSITGDTKELIKYILKAKSAPEYFSKELGKDMKVPKEELETWSKERLRITWAYILTREQMPVICRRLEEYLFENDRISDY